MKTNPSPTVCFSVPVLSTSLSHFSAFYSSVIFFCSCFSTISTFIPLLICPYPSFHAPPHSLSPSPSRYLFLSISLHTSLSHFSNRFSQSYPSVYPSLNLLSTGNGFFPKKGGGGWKRGSYCPKQRGQCVNPPKIQRRKGRAITIRNLLSSASLTHISFFPLSFSPSFPFFRPRSHTHNRKHSTHIYSHVWTQSV